MTYTFRAIKNLYIYNETLNARETREIINGHVGAPFSILKTIKMLCTIFICLNVLFEYQILNVQS